MRLREPFTFHTYTVLVDLGLLAGLLWLYFSAGEGEAGQRLDAGLATAAGGLIGARLGYVLANGAYFGVHPGEALRVWDGGLSWPGAALGGLGGLWLWREWKGLPFMEFYAALALPAMLISALSWAGCWAAACAYGAETASRLGTPALDMFGMIAARWPTQPAGAALSLAGLAILASPPLSRTPTGFPTTLALALISGICLALSLFRADPTPILSGQRLDTWASGVMLALAGVALLYALAKTGRARSTK
ncbi:MAG: prolipoprotein diacylglyceryl transferase [Chloroflexi bacterium]|nr:prolipoprotein diacylglyceryl transferase [Chloroflexota bacterium]